ARLPRDVGADAGRRRRFGGRRLEPGRRHRVSDWSRYDESDAKVRPGKGSRPRSKNRPAHSDAVDGMVVGVDRGRYTVRVDDVTVMAVKARELGRRGLVVGDAVGLVGDVSGT